MRMIKTSKPQRTFTKNVFLWALYNFANTPITIAMGGLFLAQWVVLDNKIDDIWYGGTFTLATIFLLITSPFLGAWSDKSGRRMPFLKWSTYIQVIVGFSLGIVAVSGMASIPKVIVVLVLFFFLQYFYQISLIFYNAILYLLSTSSNRGRVSGITEVFDNIGWLLGPALLLPFSVGYLTVFGQPGRTQVFLPAIIIFIITGLPMIFWFKEPRTKSVPAKIDFRGVYKDTIDGFKLLFRKEKNVTRFLLSFMFISDALLTGNLYFAIYLDQVFNMSSDIQKYIALALMEVVALLSAYAAGKIADQIGTKKILLLSCVNLTLVYGLISVTSSLPLAYALSAFIGLGYGGFYTTSRAMLVEISPAPKLGEYFGFYSTFQKFASIIGPLTWGAITLTLKNYGVFRYRAGIFALSMLMLIGTLLLIKVKERRIEGF